MTRSPYASAYSQQQAQNHYQQMEIKTADPFELILIIYRGALKNLTEALEHMEAGRIEQRVGAINKSVELIAELKSSLDFEQGKHIARSLDQLYTYMLKRLTEANLRQDPEPLREVIKLMRTLESAWAEARANLQPQQRAEGEKVQLSA